MKNLYSLCLALVLVPFAASSHAVLLDFESLDGVSAQAGPIVPVAVIDDEFASDGILFGKAGISAGVGVINSVAFIDSMIVPARTIGGLDAGGILPGVGSGCCTGDIYFKFLGVTDLISFIVGDLGGDFDVFEIRAYDIANTLVDLQNVQGDSFQNVTIAVAGIHRVEVDFDNSNEYGYALDDLQFNEVTPVTVPAPSVLVLMFAGMLSLGFSRSKKRG
jgi:hypothetical protein